LEEGTGFKIKRIEVKPGASLSLQMHHHRSEHWVVVAGEAKVMNGSEIIISVNESTFIPAGHQHRLTNPGKDLCVLIEVQTVLIWVKMILCACKTTMDALDSHAKIYLGLSRPIRC
jgi:mannose-6-phosphate isomerase-like protein (cupin superfamily)